MSKKSVLLPGQTPSGLIDARIASFDDWRGPTLATLRGIITRADPAVVEEWKWGGPVWSGHGIICTGEVYKSAVKLTFAKGASLKDPTRLFNSSLEGNTRRAIDVREGDTVDANALAALIKAAVALNRATGTGTKLATPAKSTQSARAARTTMGAKAAKAAKRSTR